MSNEKSNIMGETFDQWFYELCEDFKIAHGEDYGMIGDHGRDIEQLRTYWDLGWDLDYVEAYEAWRDYDPAD